MASIARRNMGWDHFYRFSRHMVCYLPVVALVGMGWMQNIHLHALKFFLIDGISTVSLVLCCDCWGHISQKISEIGARQRHAAKNEATREKAIRLEEQLSVSLRRRGKYSLCTALTLLGWLIVSQHTLQEMGRLHLRFEQGRTESVIELLASAFSVSDSATVPSSGKAAGDKEELTTWDWVKQLVLKDSDPRTVAAVAITGFSFLVAVWKAWDMTSEKSIHYANIARTSESVEVTEETT